MKSHLKVPLAALVACLLPAVLLASVEEHLDRRFPAQPGGELVIDVDFGGIEVSTNAGPEIVVEIFRKVRAGTESREKEFLAERPVEFEQDGGTLRIRSRKSGGTGFPWNWGPLRLEGLYKVRVPADHKVRLRTAGGHIEVKGVQAPVQGGTSGGSLRFKGIRGPIEGETSGGSVSVVACDGEVKVGTSGGGIVVEDGTGTLDARTSGGSIRLVRFAGPIKARTSGGSVSAVVPSAPLPGPVDLATAGGSVSLELPDGAAFLLDAETAAGSVRSEFAVESDGKPKRSKLVGPVNGGGAKVRLRTSGGSISVRRSEPVSTR